MTSLLLVAACSFGMGVILMPLARALALRVGLVDGPDGRRKMQRTPIPLAGGLVVFVATVATLAVVFLVPGLLPEGLQDQAPSLVGLLLAAAVICGVGLADDFHSLRGRHKLFGQLAAIGIVMSSGVVVHTVQLFGVSLELGPLALPFTALWLLGAINALNLIDGMDGLLGCVGVIICLAMAVLAAVSGQFTTVLVACALLGALLAFLCYNLPPASVFLGDSGSMLVGLVIGVLAIESSLKGPATVALAAPVALLIVPFFDTFAAIVRRKLTGRSIYDTDRAHIHHCLQRGGMSNQKVLIVISALCCLTVAGILASLALQNEMLAVIAAAAVVGILVVGRLFGHAEALLIKKRLVGLLVRLAHGNGGPQTHQLEVRLQGSTDWTDLWGNLTNRAANLGLRTVWLDVNAPALHEGYHARWDRYEIEDEAPASWRAEFPLVVRGQALGRLEFTGERGPAPVADIMRAVLKLAEDVERDLAELIPEAVAMPAPNPDDGLRLERFEAEGRLLASPVNR